MRRMLWVTLCLCLSLGSGCYTVLRHPAVDDAEEPVELGVTEDCRACHTGRGDNLVAWSPLPCAPQWQAFCDRPWWERVAANNARIGTRAEGAGMPNNRPLPWAAAPVAPAPSAPPAVETVKVAPDARPSAPASAPRDSEHRATPAAGPRGTEHRGNPVPAPHPPGSGAERPATAAPAPHPAPVEPLTDPNAPPPTNDDEATPGSSAAPESPAPPESNATPAQSEGQGMPNNRPRPAR